MRLTRFFGAVLCAVSLFSPNLAKASTTAPQAQVSITIDDGFESVTNAASMLRSRGLTGTAYIVTGWVGTKTGYIKSWNDVRALRDVYGLEIGSHSVTHPLMTTITASQVDHELVDSKIALANQGITAVTFAYPYGDYDDSVVPKTAQNYWGARGFFDTDAPNTWPFTQTVLHNQQVQGGVTVAQVKAWIDSAIANKEWLILVFHDIQDVPDPDPQAFQYGTSDFAAIADYIKTTGIRCCSVADGLAADSPNLLPDSSFWTGAGGAWHTDDPGNIVSNLQGKGALPTPSSSISLKNTTSSTKNSHLFSPTVPVSFGTLYGVKAFLNLQKITKGEFGLYIDEYEVGGNWVSGQYMGGITQASVGEIALTYSPSAANVASASLQVILVKGAGITAWLDSPRWVPAH